MMTEMLKPRVPDNCVIHSFRHSMRDRLRAVECPADIIDAIGGWSTDGVGQSYGRGYDLNVLGLQHLLAGLIPSMMKCKH